MLRSIPLLVALFASSPLYAQSSDDLRTRARARFDEAQAHYKLGRFADALEGYRAAYELVPHPDILFNMGQCHRHLENCERALFFYRQYLEASPQAENKKLVLELIDECEREQPRAQAPTTDSPPPPPLAVPPPAPPPTAPPPPAVAMQVPADEAPIYETWWFWTVVGALAAGAGVAVFVATRSEDIRPEPGTLGTLDWTDD